MHKDRLPSIDRKALLAQDHRSGVLIEQLLLREYVVPKAPEQEPPIPFNTISTEHQTR